MFDANTALNQLVMAENGRTVLALMIGAKHFARGEDNVSFKFPRSNSINYCKLTLTPDDLYTLELGYIHGLNYKVRKELKGLYWDQLKEIFENETKLYLSLS
jgi:hypothetical protein